MSYHTMKRHGWNWRACYSASLKWLHIVKFQLYDILEKIQLKRYLMIDGYQWFREREDEQSEHRVLLGQWNSSMILKCWMLIITHFWKPIEHTTPRVNLGINYELKVRMMCQCILIDCYKCNVLWQNVDNGKVVWGWDEKKEVYWNSLNFLFNFAMN